MNPNPSPAAISPDEFTIFIVTRIDKKRERFYGKIEYQVGSRFDDINYVIEAVLTSIGETKMLEYLLKDSMDGTLILHPKSFYPGIICSLVKKKGNGDLRNFFLNIRESYRYNLNKIDENVRMKKQEDDMDVLMRKNMIFGKNVACSPLRMGYKPIANRATEGTDLFKVYSHGQKLTEKESVNNFYFCYNSWGAVPLEVRQGPSAEATLNQKKALTQGPCPTALVPVNRYKHTITPYGQTVTIKEGI